MSTPSPQSIAQAEEMARTYNLASSMNQGAQKQELRMDADETVMLALELESMRAKVYEADYPEVKARRFIPVNNEDDTGADSFSYEEQDYAGKAKVIRNHGDDPPAVEVKGAKVTHSIVSLGDMFSWSLQDVRRAVFSGKGLPARKALAARRIWERGLDDIAAYGAPDDGIATGLINRTVGTGAGQIRGTAATAANWLNASLNPALILDQLNRLTSELVIDSKETQMPDTLLLPTRHYMKIAQTQMAVENSRTILEAFLASNPWITDVQPWDLLQAVEGSTSRGVAYKRDLDVLELNIPQEFEVLPPQAVNYSWKVLCHGRTAGTIVFRPLGIRYLTGLPNAFA